MAETTEYFRQTFAWSSDSKTSEEYVIIKNNVRFSILSDRLLRVEVDSNGIFTDEPTQAVINRSFSKPKIRTVEDGDIVIIMTTKTIYRYDTAAKKMIGISLKNGKDLSEYNKGNLKGTYRTLDGTSGAIALGDGIMSTDGVAVIDDSASLILNPDGTVGERRKTDKDEYYFCYNHDYRAALRDFFLLCGEVPLVPRFCLGNWWSRYKAYTQQEYISLMKKFLEREIPVTVATIDMDWHWVDVKNRFGKCGSKKSIIPGKNDNFFQGDGWTGYSWNTELFPDYKEFLRWLHDNNFKVTMNLHPAQGVRFFEDMYKETAEFMGIDPESKKRVEFDITNPRYIDAYFNILHKPYEKDGVDFWWIDWQQGKNSKIKNLDPLWALNHYHTLVDRDSDSKRPLILSRFAEIGSHRYPLGFSGDTKICWEALEFQPYFTNTATNIGYTWWSHDIGGHMMGSKDDELYTRWIQYGLYSPIMRLHSTSNEFMGKEPWKHEYAAEQLAVRSLRERHALIPYLYSMNYRTHKYALALCEPMYYAYPEQEDAYKVKNQYFFGSELIVAPITTKINPKTNLAGVEVWLPEGRWTDIYTGASYSGGKKIKMFRGLESIPVLAREGAIIPLSTNDRDNDWSNPTNMTLRIFRGDNTFKLYEDDGETNAYKKGDFAITNYTVCENGNTVTFTVSPAEGSCASLPKKRNYTLVFEDISDAQISLTVNGKDSKYEVREKFGKLYITLNGITPRSAVEITLTDVKVRENTDKKEQIIDLITKYQLSVNYKLVKFAKFLKNIDGKIPSCDDCLSEPIAEIQNMI
ncbi:MAG: DUF5110 domain-containing protein [Clostridia bacterium]|nr:DUF5110 domain-containing protein [Clostridia bacterium]